MKRKTILLSVFVVLIIYYICSKVLIFSWQNPYTDTTSFPYISKTIGTLAKAFNYAQAASKQDGQEYKYLFWNAYGSGFLKNNPIPNDLDFAVGIDLGEYEYDGDNADVIAKHLVDKMQSFQQNFNFYVKTNPKSGIYSTLSSFEFLTTAGFDKYGYQNCIKTHLEDALSGKGYIHYAKKLLPNGDSDRLIEFPYMMRHNEILLEEYIPMLMFSDMIVYNDTNLRYMRELSVIPEFFATINQNGKKTRIELVPESYLGARLQLSRRAFASNIFVGRFSIDYQKNLEYMHNDDEYLFYRMFTFRRHLLEVENIAELRNKPVKLLKRVMQTADAVYPLIGEEKYKEIGEWVEHNLSKPEIQAINEYENICKNIINISEAKDLFTTLSQEKKIDVMYDKLGEVLKTFEAAGSVDKDTLQAMKNYYSNEKSAYLKNKESTGSDFLALIGLMNQFGYNQIDNPERIQEYIDLFNAIFIKSGYRRIDLCWIDKNTIGVVKDEFTSKITDWHKFASDNGLADLNYKLINKSEIPLEELQYEVWVRYNSSQEEEENYQRMNRLLLEDKKNFDIKKKVKFAF